MAARTPSGPRARPLATDNHAVQAGFAQLGAGTINLSRIREWADADAVKCAHVAHHGLIHRGGAPFQPACVQTLDPRSHGSCLLAASYGCDLNVAAS